MKKGKLLRLNAEPYEELQALVRELGWPKTWLTHEVDRLVAGLLLVAKQAKQDAEDHRQMTEAEARKRYEELMRRFLEEKR